MLPRPSLLIQVRGKENRNRNQLLQVSSCTICFGNHMGSNFDTLIRNGMILDGSGAPAQQADVGLRGDRIAAIGNLSAATAAQVVDAAGMVLAPGFIDAHSHSDAFLLIEPDAPSKVSQGVTTEIVGQCGASAAPIFGRGRLPSDWAAFVYPERGEKNSEFRIQNSESLHPPPSTRHAPRSPRRHVGYGGGVSRAPGAGAAGGECGAPDRAQYAARRRDGV